MGRKRTGTIGPLNGMWRGGRTITQHGYVLIRVGKDHHLADVRGYAYEHRVVAEQLIGRRLKPGEIVHHVNGNRGDNRHSNLEVLANQAYHRVEHRSVRSNRRLPGEANSVVACACGCGIRFRRFDTSGRPRRYVSGHNFLGAKANE
jgi:hypothetical protein